MNRRIVLSSLLAAALGGTALYARQNATSPSKRFVHFEANREASDKIQGSDQYIHTLNGDVVISSEDSILHTEKANYNDQTQVATSPTRLRLEDKQNTLVADKGIAYYSSRDAIFTGNVIINVRPNQANSNAAKGSVRRDFKDPVTITCDKVRYNWQTKKAVLTQNLTIKQKDRIITGDRGFYDGIAETVTLVGNIKSRRPTGEAGDAAGPDSRFFAILKEGHERFEITRDPNMKNAKVRAVVPVREKPGGEYEVIESPDTPPAPDAAPAPAGVPVPVPSPSPVAPPQP